MTAPFVTFELDDQQQYDRWTATALKGRKDGLDPFTALCEWIIEVCDEACNANKITPEEWSHIGEAVAKLKKPKRATSSTKKRKVKR